MELESSLLWPQEPTTGPCPEPDGPVQSLTPCFFQILVCTLKYSEWCLPLKFFDEKLTGKQIIPIAIMPENNKDKSKHAT
jgi:hypothetical protein